jgi:hypothetical protein
MAAMGMLLALIALVAALEHGRDVHGSSRASP